MKPDDVEVLLLRTAPEAAPIGLPPLAAPRPQLGPAFALAAAALLAAIVGWVTHIPPPPEPKSGELAPLVHWSVPPFVSGESVSPFFVVVRENPLDSEIVHARLFEKTPTLERRLLWSRDSRYSLIAPFPLDPPTSANLLAQWDLLRGASLLISCSGDEGELLIGLEAASAPGRPARLRAAAAHALRHYFTVASAKAALRLETDPDERVRRIAAETVSILLGPERRPAVDVLKNRMDQRWEELKKKP